MKNVQENLSIIIDSKIDAYKKIFEGLNEQEKELLLYKKIIELQYSENEEKIDKEYLVLAIKKASGLNIGYVKTLLIYLSHGETLKATEQYQILKKYTITS